MKKAEIVAIVVTCFAIVYNALPFFNVSADIILFLFACSPFLLLYLVLVVLKNGKPSEYTFEERFYCDWDYKPNN